MVFVVTIAPEHQKEMGPLTPILPHIQCVYDPLYNLSPYVPKTTGDKEGGGLDKGKGALEGI